jgi:superfamily I DNA/RNA helicase
LANSLDFDDLLLLPYLLFKKHPEVLQKWQKQFSYILVDEAQDTNWIQFELWKCYLENLQILLWLEMIFKVFMDGVEHWWKIF